MSQTDTKATHTPGPWRVISGEVWTDTSPTGAYDAHIADMCRDEPRTLPTERDANARLIALAPEMYDALMRLVGPSVTPPTPAGYGYRGAAAFAPWEQNLIDAQNVARGILSKKGG